MTEKQDIIIVDAYKENQQILKKTLTALGFSLRAVQTGKEALKTIAQYHPAIILLNLELPDIDGLDLLRALVKKVNSSTTAIILISSSTSPDRVETALKLGAVDFIGKPFYPQILKLRLNNQLKWLKYNKEAEILHRELSEKQKRDAEVKELLSKYFSKDLIEAILSGTVNNAIGGNLLTASILFCDMRDSTTIAEKVGPSAFMDLLNSVFTDLTDIIYGEGGSVNKFVGDGILATFGCPKNLENDALHCANTAFKIRKYLNEFNQFRPPYLKEPLQFGIGMSRGEIFAGNVGSVHQIQYTVLGDPVNIASRLEGLTKRVGVDILMDRNIREILGNQAEVQRVKLTHVRGKLQQTLIYYLKNLL